MTPAKSLILSRLEEAGKPLAAHELQIWSVSDNAAATRLNELEREGKLKSHYRPGKRFKEWWIVRAEETRFKADEQGQYSFI